MKSPAWLIAGLLATGLAHAETAAVEVSEADAAAAGVPVEAPVDEPAVSLPAGKGEFWAFSYAMGHNFGARLRGDVPELDINAFQDAMRAAFAGKPSELSEAQAQLAVSMFNETRQAAAKAAQEKMAAANLAAAEAFLAGNIKRKGVKVTKSGLQYEVIKKASGPAPKPSDIVTAHYHGTLIDGTVFDSSRDGKPVDFPLDRVIPGWTEGLQLMAKGATFRFYLPPALAYGARGMDEVIGPNSLLVFEVELIDFKAPAPASDEGSDIERMP